MQRNPMWSVETFIGTEPDGVLVEAQDASSALTEAAVILAGTRHRIRPGQAPQPALLHKDHPCYAATQMARVEMRRAA